MADFQGKFLRYREVAGRQGLVTVQPLKFTSGKIRRIPSSDSVQLSTLGLGTAPTTDALSIVTASVSDKGITVKGVLSQAAALLEVLDSTDAKVLEVLADSIGVFNTTPVVQQSDPGALTDSSGGTADGTVAAVSGSGADADINNNFAELTTKYNAIRTLLRAYGWAS